MGSCRFVACSVNGALCISLWSTRRSNSRIRTVRRHKMSIKDVRDCWQSSRALCEEFSAHTSEAVSTPPQSTFILDAINHLTALK